MSETGVETSLLDEEPSAYAASDDAATNGAGPRPRPPFPALVFVGLPGVALSVSALAVCSFAVAEPDTSSYHYKDSPSTAYRFGLVTDGAADDVCHAGGIAFGSAQRLGRAAGIAAALLAFLATFGTVYVSSLADGAPKWLPGSGLLYVAAAACQAATFAFLYGLDPCAAVAERWEHGQSCRADLGPGAVLSVVSCILHAVLGASLLRG